MHNGSIRNAITRIRLSSHRYRIETGRWGNNRVQRDERVCEVCNVIESEYHVLMICPRFINERTERLPECMLTNPSEENFISMLKSKAMNVQLHLGLLCLDVQKQHLNYI